MNEARIVADNRALAEIQFTKRFSLVPGKVKRLTAPQISSTEFPSGEIRQEFHPRVETSESLLDFRDGQRYVAASVL